MLQFDKGKLILAFNGKNDKNEYKTVAESIEKYCAFLANKNEIKDIDHHELEDLQRNSNQITQSQGLVISNLILLDEGLMGIDKKLSNEAKKLITSIGLFIKYIPSLKSLEIISSTMHLTFLKEILIPANIPHLEKLYFIDSKFGEQPKALLAVIQDFVKSAYFLSDITFFGSEPTRELQLLDREIQRLVSVKNKNDLTKFTANLALSPATPSVSINGEPLTTSPSSISPQSIEHYLQLQPPASSTPIEFNQLFVLPFNSFYDALFNNRKVSVKACSLMSMSLPPQQNALENLKFTGDTAYVRSGKQLFYIDKAKNECISIPVTDEILKQFDLELAVNALSNDGHRVLSYEELNRIPLITRYTPGEDSEEKYVEASRIEKIDLRIDRWYKDYKIILDAIKTTTQSLSDIKGEIAEIEAGLKEIKSWSERNKSPLNKSLVQQHRIRSFAEQAQFELLSRRKELLREITANGYKVVDEPLKGGPFKLEYDFQIRKYEEKDQEAQYQPLLLKAVSLQNNAEGDDNWTIMFCGLGNWLSTRTIDEGIMQEAEKDKPKLQAKPVTANTSTDEVIMQEAEKDKSKPQAKPVTANKSTDEVIMQEAEKDKSKPQAKPITANKSTDEVIMQEAEKDKSKPQAKPITANKSTDEVIMQEAEKDKPKPQAKPVTANKSISILSKKIPALDKLLKTVKFQSTTSSNTSPVNKPDNNRTMEPPETSSAPVLRNKSGKIIVEQPVSETGKATAVLSPQAIVLFLQEVETLTSVDTLPALSSKKKNLKNEIVKYQNRKHLFRDKLNSELKQKAEINIDNVRKEESQKTQELKDYINQQLLPIRKKLLSLNKTLTALKEVYADIYSSAPKYKTKQDIDNLEIEITNLKQQENMWQQALDNIDLPEIIQKQLDIFTIRDAQYLILQGEIIKKRRIISEYDRNHQLWVTEYQKYKDKTYEGSDPALKTLQAEIDKCIVQINVLNERIKQLSFALEEARWKFINKWNDPHASHFVKLEMQSLKPWDDPLVNFLNKINTAKNQKDQTESQMYRFNLRSDGFYTQDGQSLAEFMEFNNKNNIFILPCFDHNGLVSSEVFQVIQSPRVSKILKNPIIKLVETHSLRIVWKGTALGPVTHSLNLSPGERRQITIEKQTTLKKTVTASTSSTEETKQNMTSSFEQNLQNEFSTASNISHSDEQKRKADQSSSETTKLSNESETLRAQETNAAQSLGVDVKSEAEGSFGVVKASLSVGVSYSKSSSEKNTSSDQSKTAQSKENALSKSLSEEGQQASKQSRDIASKNIQNSIQRVASETSQNNKIEVTSSTSTDQTEDLKNKETMEIENQNAGKTINYNFYQLQNIYSTYIELKDVKIFVNTGRELVEGTSISDIRVYEIEEFNTIYSDLTHPDTTGDNENSFAVLSAFIVNKILKQYCNLLAEDEIEFRMKPLQVKTGFLQSIEDMEEFKKMARILDVMELYPNIAVDQTNTDRIISNFKDALDYFKKVPFVFKDSISLTESTFFVNAGAYHLDTRLGMVPATEPYLEDRRAVELEKLKLENQYKQAEVEHLRQATANKVFYPSLAYFKNTFWSDPKVTSPSLIDNQNVEEKKEITPNQ